MACVMKIHHDHTGCEHEGKKDSKNLQVFYNENKDNYTGYCFSCGTFVNNLYQKGDKPKVVTKTKEEILAEILEIKELPFVNTSFRGLPAGIYKKWGVRLGLSPYDGKTPFAVYYEYKKDNKLVGWKARMLPKKNFWSIGSTKGADPFGWSIATAIKGKRIYITEGEQDAMALDYALIEAHRNTPYAKRRYAIISLPNGVDSIAFTLRKVKKLGWKEIVLVMDADGAGQEAVKKAQKLSPNILIVDLPVDCKDPNEAVIKGKTKVLVDNCLWNAHKPPIKGVIQVNDVIKKATEEVLIGLSYPIDSLTEMTYGQRFGECVAIGAGVGTGKTLIAHECAAHNITVHKEPVFMVLLEEQNHDTLRNVAGKIDSIPYHRPNTVYDKEKFLETANSLQNKLIMWEADADQYLRFDIDEIINAIRFNFAEYGARFVVIDNMTRLVDHLEPSEANSFINKYASELEGLASQLDIHIDVYSHLNNTGKVPHEAGGKTLASQFTGSRGMMRSFPMMMGFERNKHTQGQDKCKSYINILKNRKYGGEGLIKTQYYPETGRLLGTEWQSGKFLESDKGR